MSAAVIGLVLLLPGCGSGDASATTPPGTQPPPAPGGTVGTAPVETRLTAPAGLVPTIFATVPGARALLPAPDGAVYVSQPGSGQVTRLADTNGDGVADARAVAVGGLDRPHGMALRDGWLYIANTGAVVRVRLGADGLAAGAPEQLARYSAGGVHWTRSIVFGRDGAMYVSVGSSCNVCVESDSDRAAVLRFDADGRGGRIFARGLRNAVGMAVEPSTGALWVSQNERDNLAPSYENLPPEEIDILRDGGDYGWPYCYGNRIPNPEYNNPGRCAGTIPPALEMQAHSAPLGMTFLTGATQLPDSLRGDLALAFHGSWNRSVPTGAKVVLVTVRDGRPTGYRDFVTGWQRADGSRWGRPADVAVLRDGSVLVADDVSGELIRLVRR